MKKYILLIFILAFFSCTEENETCQCENALGTIEYPCEFASPCD